MRCTPILPAPGSSVSCHLAASTVARALMAKQHLLRCVILRDPPCPLATVPLCQQVRDGTLYDGIFSALLREGDDVGVLLKMVRVLRDGEAPDTVHQGFIAELYIGAADLVQVTPPIWHGRTVPCGQTRHRHTRHGVLEQSAASGARVRDMLRRIFCTACTALGSMLQNLEAVGRWPGCQAQQTSSLRQDIRAGSMSMQLFCNPFRHGWFGNCRSLPRMCGWARLTSAEVPATTLAVSAPTPPSHAGGARLVLNGAGRLGSSCLQMTTMLLHHRTMATFAEIGG